MKNDKLFKNKRATKLEAKIVVTKDKDMNPDLEDVKPKGKGKGKKKKVKKADGAKGLKNEPSMESLAEANSVEEGGSPPRSPALKPKKKKKSPLKKSEKGEAIEEELLQASSSKGLLSKEASPGSRSQPKIAIPIPMPILTQDSGVSDEASNEEAPTPLLAFKDIEGQASKRELLSPLSKFSDDENIEIRKAKKKITVTSKSKNDPSIKAGATITDRTTPLGIA